MERHEPVHLRNGANSWEEKSEVVTFRSITFIEKEKDLEAGLEKSGDHTQGYRREWLICGAPRGL